MKTTRNMSKALLLGAWRTAYKKGQHRRKAALSVAAAIFLISLLPSPVSATMGQLIITTDTTLTENHFGNLIIGADNITLDCAGFSVDGTGLGIGNGIALSGRQGVAGGDCSYSSGGTAACDPFPPDPTVNYGHGDGISEIPLTHFIIHASGEKGITHQIEGCHEISANLSQNSTLVITATAQ